MTAQTTKKNTPFVELPVKEIHSKAFRCGDCAGLKLQALVEGETCVKQGLQDESKVCPKFRPISAPVVEALEDGDTRDFILVAAKGVRNMNSSQRKALAAAILEANRTEKAGYYFMQPVYVRYRGRGNSNYFSNFMTARVISADSEHVRIGSEDGGIVLTYPNDKNGSSIYTKEEFDGIKEVMLRKENLVDPLIKNPTPSKNQPLEELDLKASIDSLDGQVVDIAAIARSNKIRKGRKTASKQGDLSNVTITLEKALTDTSFTDVTEHEDLGFSDNQELEGSMTHDGMQIIEV